MLLLQQGMGSLQSLQTLHLSQRGDLEGTPFAPQHSIAYLLAPLRQHERMNIQRRCDRLHLNPRLLAQPHRRQFERETLLADLPWPGACHLDTSPG